MAEPQPYPKMLYKPDPDKQAPYVTRTVQDAAEHESARADGWVESPAEFNPEKPKSRAGR